MRGSLARTFQHNRAFCELARLVAAGEHGLWTGALPIMLEPSGASWGIAYQVVGPKLELVASEGLPVGLRPQVEMFDLGHDSGFAACRAVRGRRPVHDERLFSGTVAPRTVAALGAAGVSGGVALPVAHGGVAMGVILVGGAVRDAIDAEGFAFLEAAASFLAPAAALLAAKAPVMDARASSSAPPRPASPLPEKKSSDAGRAALDAIQQTGPLLRRMVTDLRSFVQEGCVVVADPSDLRTAVVNLIANGVEAALEKAPLHTAPSAPRCVRVTVKREGVMIALSVEDSGRGVPTEIRHRIFDAGFTTKGKGRGEGLHMVRRIARDHGGHVDVGASELGGAQLRLVLPAVLTRGEPASLTRSDTPSTPPRGAPAASPRGGSSIPPGPSTPPRGKAPKRRGDSATLPRFRAPSDRSSGKDGEGDDDDPERTRSVRAVVS